jgi:N-acetylglucosamine-6-phosphate deacetylase
MLRKGFADLQINGYLGVDFSSPSLTVDDIHRVTEALVKAGTVAFCATVITSEPEIYRRNLPVLARAMEQPALKDHLLGIHLEGPYLSAVDGARGAHAPEKMRRPDTEEFQRWQEWADGKIVILTIAPELEGSLDLISFVRRSGPVRIALGHHLASREILRQAAAAGATLITHLGNGCPNLLSRHENILIHQLANDALTAGLITDGNHIPEDFIRVALRCKGTERVFIVSDSVPIAGFAPGIYETMGNRVRLTSSGRVENLYSPYLAGSGCNMAQCMRFLRSLRLLTEDELWQVGLENPLRILGIAEEPGAWASLPDFRFDS